MVIPPKIVDKYRFAIYDGIVFPGAVATIPSPLPSQSFDAEGFEPVGALGEVKTGHRFLLRIINGNPLPAVIDENGEKIIPSDEDNFNKLIKQVRKEALIAKACQKKYFLSFDLFGSARAGASLINSQLALEGISVRVRYIEFGES